jgi:hypothetical protein
MKASEYATWLINEHMHGLDIDEVLQKLTSETLELIKIRHAQKAESIKSCIDEINNKWLAAIRKVKANPEYEQGLSRFKPEMFIDFFMEKEPLVFATAKKIQNNKPRFPWQDQLPLEERLVLENLSDEQIENWRKVLCGMFGIWGLVMPKEEVQRFRDRMQMAVNNLSEGK